MSNDKLTMAERKRQTLATEMLYHGSWAAVDSLMLRAGKMAADYGNPAATLHDPELSDHWKEVANILKYARDKIGALP